MNIYARVSAASVVPQSSLNPLKIARAQALMHFVKHLESHLKFDEKGFLLTDKIPAALLNNLSAGEILTAQTLLIRGRVFQILSRPINPETIRSMQELVGSVLNLNQKGKASLQDIFALPRGHYPRVTSCDTLLAELAAQLAVATQAAAQVNADIQSASSLLSQGQASSNPLTKLSDATTGLAALTDVGNQATIANNALTEAGSLVSQMSNHIPPCSQETVTEANTILQQIQAADGTANTWTGNWIGLIFFTGIFASLQQLQQQAIASMQPPPPSCFQVSTSWFGEVDVKLNEPCTQQVIGDLQATGGVLAIGGAIAGAVGGAVGAIVGGIVGTLAGFAALIQGDIQVADNANHKGVTLHFSPLLFPVPGNPLFATLSPLVIPAELTTLITEIGDPGFGNVFISPFWISAN